MQASGTNTARLIRPAAGFPWMAILIGACIVLVAVRWTSTVASLGQNLPMHDLTSDYLIGVGWALFLTLVLLVWPMRWLEKKLFLLLWGAKCVVALVFMLFYEASYAGLDAYDYFESGLAHAAPVPSLGDGTENIAYFAWLHNRILPGSYHAMKITFAMIGLVAIYFFFKAASVYLGRAAHLFLLCLGLFPSVLFWSTILGKDPVAFLGISLYTYGAVCWFQTKKSKYIAIVCVGILLAVLIRVWLGPVLLLPLCTLILRSDALTNRVKVAGLFLAVLVIGALVFFLRDQFGVEYAEDVFTRVDAVSQSWATGGSAQELPFEIDSLRSLVAFIPIGGFAALFRPLPGEIPGLFGLLAGVENTALLCAVLWAGLKIRRSDFRNPVVSWVLVLVVCWTLEYSIISYQNLGTASRFRLQVLPFLIALSLFLSFRKPAVASSANS